MNLHALAAGPITRVNPNIQIIIRISQGYSIAADGRRAPQYAPPAIVYGNVQPVQYQDIQHLDFLNIQGERRKIYINGRIEGLRRVDKMGGDLVMLPDKTIWLVAVVMEDWPEWCSFIVTLQNDKASDAVGQGFFQ